MRRYLRIYRTFFASSLIREMEFRANFFAKVVQSVGFIAFFLLIVLVIYGNTDSVAGWGRGEAFLLTATVFLIEGLFTMFFRSLHEIPGQVRLGTLDFVITKPVDTQFWISTRRFNLEQIGVLLSGTAMMAMGIAQSRITPGVLEWLAYVTLLIAALAMYYAFTLAMMTTGVWLVRVDNLWVLTENVATIARYPLDIYALGVQRLFLFVFPLAFLGTVPVRQLTRGFDPAMVGLGLLWAVVGLALARGFWRYALGHYTSASS